MFTSFNVNNVLFYNKPIFREDDFFVRRILKDTGVFNYIVCHAERNLLKTEGPGRGVVKTQHATIRREENVRDHSARKRRTIYQHRSVVLRSYSPSNILI